MLNPVLGQDEPFLDARSSGLVVVERGADYELTGPGGVVIQSTSNAIVNARLIEVSGSAAWLAVWDEVQASRQNQSFYRVSPDGQTLSRVRQTANVIRLRYANFDPLVDGEPVVAAEFMAPESSELYLVQFFAPPLEEMRQAIRALGGDVVRYMADHTHVVRMSANTRDAVSQLPYVRWTSRFHVAYKLDGEILSGLTAGMSESAATYAIEVFDRGPAQQNAIKDRIVALGGSVNGITPESFHMDVNLTPAQLREIVKMDELHFIDEYGPMEVDLDIVRQISGANFIETAAGFTGQGTRGEAADTGLRTTHQEFQAASGGPPLLHGSVPVDSHGTAVYGILFSSGVRPDARGILPDAERGIAAHSSLLLGTGNITNRFNHTAELLLPPYEALFQTNSTGNSRTTQYTNLSAAMDDNLFHNQVLHAQSMSNANLNQDVRPQAWAKNIIGVGGITHGNTLTRSDDRSSGSVGPAADGRIKPDLSHFYDQTLTTTSSSNTAYTQFGGTSGATPCTVSHSGLFFQMWHEGVWSGRGGAATVFQSRAHMATAKAAMINTAFRYDWNSGGPNANMIRTHQGWGMVNVANMYNLRDDTFIIDEEDLITPFGSASYLLTVAPGAPSVNFTLVYVDPMGPTSANLHRINDLSLKVTSPGATVYWGNNGLLAGNWSTPGGLSNTKDTVENVFVQNPQAGSWTVQVFGDVIVQDSHLETPALDADFSLFVTGITPIPPPLIIQLPNGVPPSVLPFVATDIPVTIEDGLETLVPNSEMLHYRTMPAGAFTIVPLTPLGGINYLAALPAFTCGDQPEFYISALGDLGATVTSPPDAPASAHSFAIGGDIPLFEYDFESNAGWTVQNINVFDGGWERGVPAGNGLRQDPLTDFDGSGSCFVTGLALNADLDGGPTILTSPIFNLVGQSTATLSYARWFQVNNPDADRLDVEVSNNNGASWSLIESVQNSTGWVWRSVDLIAILLPTSQMRLRFTASDQPNNTITEAGVDAVRITAFGCDPSFFCTKGDVNGDGLVDGKDVGRFADLLINGGGTGLETCAGDLESPPNGLIDPNDIAPFVDCLLNGGC